MAIKATSTKAFIMDKEAAIQLILEATNNFQGYPIQQKNKILMNMAENDTIAFDEIIFHNKKRHIHMLNALRCRDMSDVHNVHLTEWFELTLILYITNEKRNWVIVFGDTSEKVKEAISFIEASVEEDVAREKEKGKENKETIKISEHERRDDEREEYFSQYEITKIKHS